MDVMSKVISGGGNALAKCALAALLALCMCMGVAPRAHATGAPCGTLTLECSYGSGDDARVVAGDSFEAVCIADAQVGDGSAEDLSFTLLEGFEALDCEWTTLSASQLHDKALEAVNLIARGASGVDGRTAQADASARRTVLFRSGGHLSCATHRHRTGQRSLHLRSVHRVRSGTRWRSHYLPGDRLPQVRF